MCCCTSHLVLLRADDPAGPEPQVAPAVSGFEVRAAPHDVGRRVHPGGPGVVALRVGGEVGQEHVRVVLWQRQKKRQNFGEIQQILAKL